MSQSAPDITLDNPWSPGTPGSLASILAKAASLDLVEAPASPSEDTLDANENDSSGSDFIQRWIGLRRDLHEAKCDLELSRLIHQYRHVFDESHPKLIRSILRYYEHVTDSKQKIRNLISAPVASQALILPKRYHRDIVESLTWILSSLPKLRGYEHDLAWASTDCVGELDQVDSVCSRLNQRLGQLERYFDMLTMIRSKLGQYAERINAPHRSPK